MLIVAQRTAGAEWVTACPSIALCVPLAWLLGTFPSAQLVARAHGRDILKEGSGNPGASNVARLLGWRAGAIVLLLDFAKGLIAAGAGMAIGGRPGAFALGVAAIVGHTFPIYRKGGKGIATGGGALVVLYPLIVVGARGRVVRGRAACCTRRRSRRCSARCCSRSRSSRCGYDTWEIVIIAALAVLVVSASPR